MYDQGYHLKSIAQTEFGIVARGQGVDDLMQAVRTSAAQSLGISPEDLAPNATGIGQSYQMAKGRDHSHFSAGDVLLETRDAQGWDHLGEIVHHLSRPFPEASLDLGESHDLQDNYDSALVGSVARSARRLTEPPRQEGINGASVSVRRHQESVCGADTYERKLDDGPLITVHYNTNTDEVTLTSMGTRYHFEVGEENIRLVLPQHYDVGWLRQIDSELMRHEQEQDRSQPRILDVIAGGAGTN